MGRILRYSGRRTVVLRLLGSDRSLTLPPHAYPIADTAAGLVVAANRRDPERVSRRLSRSSIRPPAGRLYPWRRPAAGRRSRAGPAAFGPGDQGQALPSCTVAPDRRPHRSGARPLTGCRQRLGRCKGDDPADGIGRCERLVRAAHRWQSWIKITDTQIGALRITHHKFHGEWNYTLRPIRRRSLMDM